MTALDDLARPFERVLWKIQVNPKRKGGKALVIPYIDARMACQRLDRALGIGGWSSSFSQVVDDPQRGLATRCTITVHPTPIAKASAEGGEFIGVSHEIQRTDVGTYFGAMDDRAWKGAYSDALKRAAVQLDRISHDRFCFIEPALLTVDPAQCSDGIDGIGIPLTVAATRR